MSETDKKIYKLNNDICFRVCTFDDCIDKQLHWSNHLKKCVSEIGIAWTCVCEGDIHLHCQVHREIELSEFDKNDGRPKSMKLLCPICNLNDEYQLPSSLQRLDKGRILTLKQQAKSLLNSKVFKGAKLIRLDDYYMPQLSEKELSTKESKYWMSYDVKENKEGKVMLVLYLGCKQDGSKVQFFIEPETKKLSHDHKDTTPISVISRIEVQFKDGIIELKDRGL